MPFYRCYETEPQKTQIVFPGWTASQCWSQDVDQVQQTLLSVNASLDSIVFNYILLRMYVGFQFSSVAQSCLTLCDSMWVLGQLFCQFLPHILPLLEEMKYFHVNQFVCVNLFPKSYSKLLQCFFCVFNVSCLSSDLGMIKIQEGSYLVLLYG